MRRTLQQRGCTIVTFCDIDLPVPLDHYLYLKKKKSKYSMATIFLNPVQKVVAMAMHNCLELSASF